MDPFERLRRRVTDPVESLAQAVAERVIEVVVQALDLNEIISRIDLNAVLDQVDVNHVIDRVDVNHVIDRVDVDRLIDRVDLDEVLEHVDVDAIVRRVDVDALMERVDVNALVNRIDVDTLIAQTDLGSIIARSTSGFASEALDTLRAQAVMIDQWADRWVWRLERRKGERPRMPSYEPRGDGLPAGAPVPRTGVTLAGAAPPQEAAPVPGAGPAQAAALPPALTAPGADPPAGPGLPPSAGPQQGSVLPQTTTAPPAAQPPHDAPPDLTRADGPVDPAAADLPHQAGSPLGAGVPQAVGPGRDADPRRVPAEPGTGARREAAPPRGAGPAPPDGAAAASSPAGDRRDYRGGSTTRARRRATWASLHGHYAGGASRLAAWIIDIAVASGAFTLALAGISYAATVISGHTVSYSRANWIVATAYGVWLFAYFAYPWTLSGKTLGMALLGVRVVAQDGTRAGWRRAVIRTLALPLSFLIFGLGLAGIVLQKQNRALHDFIAGTVVVYAWDARAARIRFLARAGEPAEPAAGRAPGR